MPEELVLLSSISEAVAFNALGIKVIHIPRNTADGSPPPSFSPPRARIVLCTSEVPPLEIEGRTSTGGYSMRLPATGALGHDETEDLANLVRRATGIQIHQ